MIRSVASDGIAGLAWRPDAARASLDRWHQVCRQEGWGDIPGDRDALIRIFGSSWYFTRFLFFRGQAAASLLDVPRDDGLPVPDLKGLAGTGTRPPDKEDDLEGLRIARNEYMLRLLCAWLEGRVDQEVLEARLSDLAGEVLQALVTGFGLGPGAVDTPVSVLAMGRFAGREMNFGSDLDLIFLHQSPGGAEPFEVSRRVRRLLRHVSAVTPAGALYDVDMRLRPHGTAGALLTSRDAFLEYHRGVRETWERQFLTRCRPVHDPGNLGADSLLRLRPVIYGIYEPGRLRSDIRDMRRRVEVELGSPHGKLDLKRGRGGLMDVDFAAHYLQLRHGAVEPAVQACATREVLRQALTRGLADEGALRALLAGYERLKRMETCLRLFDMKSTSVVDPDSEAGHALAAAMLAPVDFMRGYLESTQSVRSAFESVLEAA